MRSARLLLAIVFVSVAGLFCWRLRDTSPASSEDVFRAALKDLEDGRGELIESALRQLDTDPQYRHHVALLDGILFLRTGHLEESIQKLESIPEHSPLTASRLRYLGEARYRRGDLEQAESILLHVLSRNPQSTEAHRWLAALYYDLGAYDRARVHLDALLAVAPDDLSAHRLAGLMYSDFSEYGQAIPHYERVLELSPPADVRRDVTLELAKAHLEQNQYREVFELLSESEFPLSFHAQALRATAAFNLGFIEEARKLVGLPIEDQELVDPTGLLLIAELHNTNGDTAEALHALDRAVELFPYDAESRYRRGLQLQKLGREAEAQAELARWEELKDQSTRLTELNLQALSNPWDAEVRDQLAEVCRELGKDDLADMWTQAAAHCRRRNASTPDAQPASP